MTDPDRAPQPVEEAAIAAGAQIRRVWELAFAQGVREGMEAAAKVCEAVATATRQKPVTEFDVPAIGTASFCATRSGSSPSLSKTRHPLQNATPPQKEKRHERPA